MIKRLLGFRFKIIAEAGMKLCYTPDICVAIALYERHAMQLAHMATAIQRCTVILPSTHASSHASIIQVYECMAPQEVIFGMLCKAAAADVPQPCAPLLDTRLPGSVTTCQLIQSIRQVISLYTIITGILHRA